MRRLFTLILLLILPLAAAQNHAVAAPVETIPTDAVPTNSNTTSADTTAEPTPAPATSPTAPVETALTVEPGLTPDNPLWALDVIADKILLALANGPEKAELGLKIAEERLAEVNAMGNRR